MTELTKNLYRTVKSLDERKTRRKENAFKAEGTKMCARYIEAFYTSLSFATYEWLETHSQQVKRLSGIGTVVKVTRNDLSRMSSLTTPSDVIAVYEIPKKENLNSAICHTDLSLLLTR